MDIKMDELEGLIQQLTSFDRMYQQTRVIDPVNKTVLYHKNHQEDDPIDLLKPCYGIWGSNNICKNCVAMRAYHENDTVIKIETARDKIIMITAIPVVLGGRKVVVELLKDVTKSMVLEDIKLSDSTDVKRILQQTNLAAVTDELTRTFNKRYISEKLPADIAIARLQKKPLSLIMTDIDHFKSINDTYGHLAGDYILKQFAAILAKSIRQEKDWVARFGGEEFLVCLGQTGRDAAGDIAERMRKAIEEATFDYQGQSIKLTASFGLCTIEGETIEDYETLIHCADSNLYRAKRTGRNVVVG